MKRTMLLSEFVQWQEEHPLATVLLDIKPAKCLVSEVKQISPLHVDMKVFLAPQEEDFDLEDPFRITLPGSFTITFTHN